MSLFIELYLDEDVSILLADLLGARGFDATTTRETGMLGKSDIEQLDYAMSKKKTLLTHNRIDFENLHNGYLAMGKGHHGIIIATRKDEYSLLKRLLAILNTVTANEIENQLRYI